MTLTWENGHIRTDFCEDLGRHRLVDPWNGADQLLLLPKRLDLRVDLDFQSLDLAGQKANVLQGVPDHPRRRGD
jgi:hypothetical protein